MSHDFKKWHKIKRLEKLSEDNKMSFPNAFIGNPFFYWIPTFVGMTKLNQKITPLFISLPKM